jgi:hypothetical protein
MEVSIKEVVRWQSLHAGEYVTSVRQGSREKALADEVDLIERRRRLMQLLRSVDAELRHLDARLAANA